MTSDNAEMIPAAALPLRQLVCARCGGEFQCGTGGADGGCWCMDEAARLPMPATGSGDCLCPQCLRSALAQHSAGQLA
jgi:hypothetical protein